jgi:hypothetical protein
MQSEIVALDEKQRSAWNGGGNGVVTEDTGPQAALVAVQSAP